MVDLPRLDGPERLPQAGEEPRSLVILLHGYGSNGEDLIALADHWAQALPDTAFLAPNAPRPCAISAWGFEWWPLASFAREELAAGVRLSAPALDAYVDAQLARFGLAEDRLALVGFSQGTMMALHVGPRRRRTIAGIVGYSGALVDPDALALELQARPPVLLVHGDADATVPAAATQEARIALDALGFEVATHLSPGLGHGVDHAGLELGGRFLADRLG